MKRSGGFALLSAIFLLVVLAMLGAFAVNISNSQHMGSVADLQGARVYQAARTGLEWGAFRQMRNSSCAASTNLVLPATAVTFNGIAVTVECAAGGNPLIYHVVATACTEPTSGACPNTTNPSPLYIERRVEIFF